MTPEGWKEQFESETIIKRQRVSAIDDQKYDDPCDGELKRGEQYIMLTDKARYIWLEGLPEHGTFPSHWFRVLEDLPLESKEWKPKVGEIVVCQDPDGGLIGGGLYTIEAIDRGYVTIDSCWYKQTRFTPVHTGIDLAEPPALPDSDPADTRAEADQAMMRADEYNRVGEARQPSERERAWEQAKRQTEIASYSVDAICRGTARVTGHRLSRAVRLTESRAIHPQAMCYHIDQ